MTPELKSKIKYARELLGDIFIQLDRETTEVRTRADLVETVTHFVELRGMQGTLSDMKNEWAKVHDFLSYSVIPDIFKEHRQTTGMAPPYRIDGIGRVNVAYKWNASILPDKKDDGKQWLRDNGAGALVIETVNASSLSAYAKDLFINNDQELPPNIFKSGQRPYTSISEKEIGNGE